MKSFENIRVNSAGWFNIGVYAVVLMLVYFSAFFYMITHDWAKEDYSHCVLIPLALLYLLWEKRGKIAAAPSAPSSAGFVPFGIGLCLFWLGELGGEYFTLYISFWFVMVGLLWVHLGREKIKAMWFILVLMLTMFPFPQFINAKISLQLRLISSKVGVSMLHLFGISAYREGNIIDIGLTRLQVIDACSGLAYVMPLMVLALFLTVWFRAAFWKKIILFLSAIPLAIFVNSCRIAMTGVLYNMFGIQVAEGFFHGFAGWLVFVFTIPVLLFEMWVLGKVPPRGNTRGQQITGTIKQGGGAERTAIRTRLKCQLLQPVFLVCLATLLSTFGLTHGIEFRQKVPVSKPFREFPMEINEWQGSRQYMEQRFINSLRLSDYIIANYRNGQGQAMTFFVAYYQDQHKGGATHSPESCLPGSGWEFRESGTIKLTVSEGKPAFTVNRALMEKGDARQLVYYWFPQRGRLLTNLYQLKLYTFWDSLTQRRSDGALVRIIADIGKNERLSDTESRLQRFIGMVTPILDEYIPK